MGNARVVQELFVKAPTRVGLLADLASAISAKGIGILAIGAYDKEGSGEFYLITTDNEGARAALTGLGVQIEANDVVVAEMEDRPGSLSASSRRLADAGINVDWVYATTVPGPTASVVFRVSDPGRAAAVLSS